MIVNVEFLGEEPIENVITCMNFKIDKTIFFGYSDMIKGKRDSVENFLTNHCYVKQVEFYSISQTDLQSIVNTIRTEVQRETENGNKVYFDVTGGESLILVAFGMLSKDLAAPMHLYDIEKNYLMELEEGAPLSIEKDVQKQFVKLTLDYFVELQGGVINYQLHNSIAEKSNPIFIEDVGKIWEVAGKQGVFWNPFSDLLKEHCIPNSCLEIVENSQTIVSALHDSKTNLKTPAKLNEILDDLATAGVLLDVIHRNGQYKFKYKNLDIKDILHKGGIILELYTYYQQEKDADDCMMGVHLDWDGVIQPISGVDILNEIDVFCLNGNIPTFISCKSGKMGQNQTLHALYELKTVTERFGGKYAKMKLVVAQELSITNILRAKEMKIEIVQNIERNINELYQ